MKKPSLVALTLAETRPLGPPRRPSAGRARLAAASLALLLDPALALAIEVGDEVDVTAGAVTALPCAQRVLETGNLELLGSCPLPEAARGIVVFDVAERQIYVISPKKVFRYELDKAFAGGSIDFTGRVVAVDPTTGAAIVDVEEYSVTPKPKAGAFKGCL